MNSRLDLFRDWDALAEEARYSTAAAARLCQVSDRHLRRYFLSRFGTTPQVWIEQTRMRKAAALLLDGYPVKRVAFELHFRHCSHFCFRFKQMYGVSPRAYALSRNSFEVSEPV